MRAVHPALLLLLLAACARETTSPPRTGAQPPPSAGRVQAGVVVTPRTDGRAELAVRLASADVDLGAFQGSIRFPPTAFALESVAHPGDDAYFVNTADAGTGTIRFSGFSVQGFRGRDVLTLVVQPRRPLGAPDLTLQLDVVGTVTGDRIAPDELIILAPSGPGGVPLP